MARTEWAMRDGVKEWGPDHTGPCRPTRGLWLILREMESHWRAMISLHFKRLTLCIYSKEPSRMLLRSEVS